MIYALVFDSDAPFRSEDDKVGGVHASTRLAGLTLLRRARLMACRAGAQGVTFVASDAGAAERWRASEGPGVEVVLDREPSARVAAADRVLVLSAQVLPSPDLPDQLLARAGSPARPVATAAEDDPRPGPAVVNGAELNTLADHLGYSGAVRTLLENPGAHWWTVRAGAVRRLDSPQAVAAADRALYVGLTSTTDGWVDRVFNRHVSRRFTRLFINYPITPNHVTGLHFALGLMAAALFWQGDYPRTVLGALLFQLSVALDCTDGEIARLKYQFSKLGSALDVAADNVVTVAIFAAIAHAAAGRLGPSTAGALGLSAVLGVLLSVLVVLGMARLQARRHPGAASSLAVTNRLAGGAEARQTCSRTLVDRVINEATSRDFSVLVVACALAGHLEWFAWLAGVGSHVFWVTFAIIQGRMLLGSPAEHAETRGREESHAKTQRRKEEGGVPGSH